MNTIDQGHRLRVVQKTLELSQSDFGRLFEPGVLELTVRNYQNNASSPRLSSLGALHALGVNVAPYVLGESEDVLTAPVEVVKRDVERYLEEQKSPRG